MVQRRAHVNLEASIWKDFTSFAIIWRLVVQYLSVCNLTVSMNLVADLK